MSRQALDLSRTGIRSLHDSFLKVSQSFASYNYREYFVRKTNHRFETELPSLLQRFGEEGGREAREKALRPWFEEAERDLAQLKRAAIVNRMFEAPKLVVEGPGLDTVQAGGGASFALCSCCPPLITRCTGAGMEASYVGCHPLASVQAAHSPHTDQTTTIKRAQQSRGRLSEPHRRALYHHCITNRSQESANARAKSQHELETEKGEREETKASDCKLSLMNSHRLRRILQPSERHPDQESNGIRRTPLSLRSVPECWRDELVG